MLKILFCHDEDLSSELSSQLSSLAGQSTFTLSKLRPQGFGSFTLAPQFDGYDILLLWITTQNQHHISDFIARYSTSHPCNRILLTGDHPGEEAVVAAIRAGASDYIASHKLADSLQTIIDSDPATTQSSLVPELTDDILLNSLLMTAGDGIAVIDQLGIIDKINTSIEAMFGYSKDELIGKNVSLLMPEPYSSQHDGFIQQYCVSGNKKIIDIGREVSGLRKDGSLFPLHLRVNEISIGERRYFSGFMRDLTLQKAIEEKLEASNKEWNYALDFFDDAIYLLDLDRRLLRANQAFYRLTGNHGKPLIGQHIADIIHPQGEQMPCPVCLAQQELRDDIFTLEPSHPDNPTARPIEVICKIIRHKDHRPHSILMTIRDLSRARARDERMRDNESKLAEAQRISHTGHWHWDYKANDMYWSDEVYRILDLSPPLPTPSYDFYIERVHPKDRKMVRQAVNDALFLMQSYSIEHRIRLGDGSIRFVHAQAEVRFDDDANPLRMMGNLQDITERVLAEKALRKNEQLFRSTFEQAAVGIAHVSLQGRFLRVNQRLCAILGFDRDDLLLLSFQDITHPDNLEQDTDQARRLIEGKINSYCTEKRYLCQNGASLWANLTVSLTRNSNHEPDFFISVIEDITSRKATELKILETLHEKDTLLHELHHRVNNNLQIISSMLSLQARHIDDSKIRQALDDSRLHIRTMALVHDHLYASRDLVNINFLDYLRHLTRRIIAIHQTDDIQIGIDLSGEAVQLPIDIALPTALIAHELIINSIKHAYARHLPHHIQITLALQAQHIKLIIRDFGKGFNYKTMNNTDSLGITIIKALSRQIGCKIEYESSDSGTTVILSIPSLQKVNDNPTKAEASTWQGNTYLS